MRLLLLLLLAAVAAYYTNPTRAVHEGRAREVLSSYHPGATVTDSKVTFEDVTSFVRGMIAGNEGRYENYYLASKYTLDIPGPAYVECWGAFTMTGCEVVEPSA